MTMTHIDVETIPPIVRPETATLATMENRRVCWTC